MTTLTAEQYDRLRTVHAHGVVHFDYEPDGKKRHPVLVYSTVPASEQPHLHALAVAGYLSEHVGSVQDGRHLPITRTAYALTALGRHVCGIRKPVMPRTRAGTAEVMGASWEE